jgi:hypothetical protein
VTTGPAQLLKLGEKDFDALFISGHRFAFQIVDLVARQLVMHLRQANAMLSLPGKSSTPAGTTRGIGKMLPTAAAAAEKPKFDELEVSPMEIDFDLDEIEITPEAGILG